MAMDVPWMRLIRYGALYPGSPIYHVDLELRGKQYRYEGSWHMLDTFLRMYRRNRGRALRELQRLASKVEGPETPDRLTEALRRMDAAMGAR